MFRSYIERNQGGLSVLPLNLSDTAASSQDGSSLEFIAAIAGRQCYIQDASGRGLCKTSIKKYQISYPGYSFKLLTKQET